MHRDAHVSARRFGDSQERCDPKTTANIFFMGVPRLPCLPVYAFDVGARAAGDGSFPPEVVDDLRQDVVEGVLRLVADEARAFVRSGTRRGMSSNPDS